MQLIQGTFRATAHGQGFPKEPYDGDLFFQTDTQKIFMYRDPTSDWVELFPSPSSSHQETSIRLLTAQICTQCGAPLRGNRCEYCGTEYK